MGLFSDNFYSWLDSHNAKPVSDEETMAEHDKHYHPDGYNPETDRCGKREQEKDRDSINPELPPFTEKKLLERFGIKVKPFSKEFTEEEKSAFANESLQEGWAAFAEEPTEEERLKTISRVGNVLSDLEKRFNCKINVDNLLVARLRDKEDGVAIGGFSLADRIATNESVIVIPTNPPEWDGQTYGHEDDRNTDDMIRHEIGHALTTKEVVSTYASAVRTILHRTCNDSLQTLHKVILGCTSEYALKSENTLEEIAELFSRVTSEDYVGGTVPVELEHLIKNDMIGGVRNV